MSPEPFSQDPHVFDQGWPGGPLGASVVGRNDALEEVHATQVRTGSLESRTQRVSQVVLSGEHQYFSVYRLAGAAGPIQPLGHSGYDVAYHSALAQTGVTDEQ